MRKVKDPLSFVHGFHLDLINAINKIAEMCIARFNGRHVDAHQDYYVIYELLNLWGQRNIDMDLLSKSLIYRKRHIELKNKSLSVYQSEGFATIINNIQVSVNIVNLIHDLIQGETCYLLE